MIQEYDRDLGDLCKSDNINAIKELLCKKDINIHAHDEIYFVQACICGYLNVVQYFTTTYTINIHADVGTCLLFANSINIAKYLINLYKYNAIGKYPLFNIYINIEDYMIYMEDETGGIIASPRISFHILDYLLSLGYYNIIKSTYNHIICL